MYEKETVICLFIKWEGSKKVLICLLDEKKTVIKREENCNFFFKREGSKKGEGSKKETVPPLKRGD